MKKPHVPVAKEGYPFIFLAAFATLVAAVLHYELTAVAGVAATAFVLFFFRDPSRVITADQDAIVSPADGKVILIEKVFDDKFINEHAHKVSIFMNVFDVHVNRTPFPGTVEKIHYAPGRFFSADTDRGALENEACAVVIEAGAGKRLAFVQIAGLLARRIVCWAEKGDALARGQRFGLIRFGSRVDLYLPMTVQLEVGVGQRVKAGETVLGYFQGS